MTKNIGSGPLKYLFLLILSLIAGTPVLAAEMEHSQHMNMGNKRNAELSTMRHDASVTVDAKSREKVELQPLETMPASGKAREGGYDDRYVMESTDVANDLPTRCAHASRGLVMINNAEWSRCGGKPEGAVNAALPTDEKTNPMKGHAGHNM